MRQIDAVMVGPLVKLKRFVGAQVGIALIKGGTVAMPLHVIDVQPQVAAEGVDHGVKRGTGLGGIFGSLRIGRLGAHGRRCHQ